VLCLPDVHRAGHVRRRARRRTGTPRPGPAGGWRSAWPAGAALANLASAQAVLGDIPAATETMRQQARLGVESGHPISAVGALSGLAELERLRGHGREALALGQQALDLCVDARGMSCRCRPGTPGVGLVYYDLDERTRSLEHLRQGLELHRPLGLTSGALQATFTLARLQHEGGDVEGAVGDHRRRAPGRRRPPLSADRRLRGRRRGRLSARPGMWLPPSAGEQPPVCRRPTRDLHAGRRVSHLRSPLAGAGAAGRRPDPPDSTGRLCARSRPGADPDHRSYPAGAERWPRWANAKPRGTSRRCAAAWRRRPAIAALSSTKGRPSSRCCPAHGLSPRPLSTGCSPAGRPPMAPRRRPARRA